LSSAWLLSLFSHKCKDPIFGMGQIIKTGKFMHQGQSELAFIEVFMALELYIGGFVLLPSLLN
jgi:hypothetical protein